MTEIVLAQGSLLRELFAFRHRVYVEELAAPRLRTPDGELQDALDARAWNYAAVRGGRVVGSVRVVDFPHIPDAPELADRYGVEPLLQRFGSSAVCHAGRLAVDASLRGSSCLVRLVAQAVRDAVARRVRFSVSDCSPELFELYRRLGYVRTHRHFIDANFGAKWAMVFCLRDREGMRRIGSPISSVVAKSEDDREGREWLNAAMVLPERDPGVTSAA